MQRMLDAILWTPLTRVYARVLEDDVWPCCAQLNIEEPELFSRDPDSCQLTTSGKRTILELNLPVLVCERMRLYDAQ